MRIEFMDGQRVICETVDMAPPSLSAEKKAQIAARVRLVRAVLGGSSQIEFCTRLGVLPQTWNTYEAGRMPADEVLDKLWSIYGVSSDYLRLGTFRGMDPDLAKRLQTTEAPERRKNKKRTTSESAA